VPGETPAYPDDSLQSLLGNWWTEDQDRQVRRGRLLRAFVPHVDQDPMTLVAEGREDPTEHRTATVRLQALRISAPRRDRVLPVAALPEFPREVRTVYRAKTRPVLVVSEGGPDVPRETRGAQSSRWQSAPALLVAPYYGIDADGSRGGWNPAFVQRIRRCEYPQYLWDRVPLPGATESVLRLDHLQPVGRSASSYEWTPHFLSGPALSIVDEWLAWLLTGQLPVDGDLAWVRSELAQIAPPA
jgi:hypothetical protein